MKKTITIQLDEDQHKAAKVAAAHAGMTFKEIFLDSVRRLEESRKAAKAGPAEEFR